MAGSTRASGSKKRASSSRGSVRPRWTDTEVEILKRLYKTHSNAAIADVLGRKVSSVVFKGHRMGLSKGKRRLKEMGRENIQMRWHPPKRRKRRKSRR